MKTTGFRLALAALCALVARDAFAQNTEAPRPTALGGGGHAVAVPAAPSAVLYSQLDNDSGSAVLSQDFETAFDAFDSEGADDFVVPDGTKRAIRLLRIFPESGRAVELWRTRRVEGASQPIEEKQLVYQRPAAFDQPLDRRHRPTLEPAGALDLEQATEAPRSATLPNDHLGFAIDHSDLSLRRERL